MVLLGSKPGHNTTSLIFKCNIIKSSADIKKKSGPRFPRVAAQEMAFKKMKALPRPAQPLSVRM